MLRAVSRENGNQRWKKAIASRPAHPPQVIGNVVVLTSASPTVSVYNALDGTIVGTYVAPAELSGPALLPPLGGPADVAMIVATRDGRLIGLRPKPATPPTPATAPTPPAPSNETRPASPSNEIRRASPPLP
jgi:hypothetical protein